jgi:peroxiredoxin
VELPRLQTLWEKYRTEGVEMVAIESNRETEQAMNFIDKAGLEFTCLENGADDAEVVYDVFRVQGYPTSWVVDRRGRIMYRHFGWEPGEEKEIEKEILSLL